MIDPTQPESNAKRKRNKKAVKRNLRPITFKGFDWTELGQIFGLDVQSDDHMWAWAIKERIFKAAAAIRWSDKEVPYRVAKWQLKQVRRYLMKLSECDHHYDGEVWKAIAVLKDDETMVKWVVTFIESAWS